MLCHNSGLHLFPVICSSFLYCLSLPLDLSVSVTPLLSPSCTSCSQPSFYLQLFQSLSFQPKFPSGHSLFFFPLPLSTFRSSSLFFSGCSLLTKPLYLWKTSLPQVSLLLLDGFSFSFWPLKCSHGHALLNPLSLICASVFQFILQRLLSAIVRFFSRS